MWSCVCDCGHGCGHVSVCVGVVMWVCDCVSMGVVMWVCDPVSMGV